MKSIKNDEKNINVFYFWIIKKWNENLDKLRIIILDIFNTQQKMKQQKKNNSQKKS